MQFCFQQMGNVFPDKQSKEFKMILENITWKSYLTAIAVVVCIYYAFYLVLIYRRRMKAMILGAPIGKEQEEYIEGGFEQLEILQEEIRHSILEEVGTDTSKEELIVQFRNRLVNYDGLRQPTLRDALTKFLIQKSEGICGITFTKEELEEQWNSMVKKN